MINLVDYAKKQIKFSVGNLFSIPVGTALLYAFTQYTHVYYVYSSLLALIATTVMNFWVQVALKNIKLDRPKKPSARELHPERLEPWLDGSD